MTISFSLCVFPSISSRSSSIVDKNNVFKWRPNHRRRSRSNSGGPIISQFLNPAIPIIPSSSEPSTAAGSSTTAIYGTDKTRTSPAVLGTLPASTRTSFCSISSSSSTNIAQ